MTDKLFTLNPPSPTPSGKPSPLAGSLDAPHVLCEGECARLVPRPDVNANKYTRGMLVVVGGSRRYPGAPVMTSMAAERAGAGYVKLCVPSGADAAARHYLLSIPVFQGFPADLLKDGFSINDAGKIEDQCAKADAFVVGPGLGAQDVQKEFVETFFGVLHFDRHLCPVVLDADALTILAENQGIMQGRESCDDVLTPHEGEAARLLGREVASREADAVELACTYGCTVVLKGHRTVIADASGGVAICEEGGPELAKAGTGDVLAGIIGALLAQGLSAFEAACLGVFVHGRAGKLAAANVGVLSVVAEDIIKKIGPAYLSLQA